MEEHPMFIDWQNQIVKMAILTESNIYAWCNPYQNSNDIHHQNRKVSPKVHVEAQKTLNSQSNPEQKEQC
jgi:hypothetical protein